MTKADVEYMSLIRDVIDNGVEKDTRSGKVKSVFGRQIRFDLKEGLPLLTVKKMFYNGILHELLWFLSGSTNIKYLVDNGVHIWDDDAYRYYKELFLAGHSEEYMMSKDEFIQAVKDERTYIFRTKKEGFMKYYKAGNLGNVYGKQWRSFGKGVEIDQIKNIIETLKTNPNDRRMICLAYNPSDIGDMALPPCHVMFQFYTKERPDGKRELSCMWVQRSCDLFLGIPFNIASYAMLTYIIADIVGMVPGELVGSLGDCHIYNNHMDAVNEMLQREGKNSLPSFTVLRHCDNIDDYSFSDFSVDGYESDGVIKAPLSVG